MYKKALSLHFLDLIQILPFRVLYNIMANQLIGEDFKDRLRTSAKLGRDLQDCSRLFQCPELESLTGAVDNGVASNSTKKDD
jgi:hypothetical protein